MAYKIFYIEDLDPESRIETLKSENFEIISYKPDVNIDNIIQKILDVNPSIVLMDYKLTEGGFMSYCDAPTIASTLRSKYKDGIQERPIVLISTLNKIVNLYRKDYTSHDLFDYAISKENALENPDRFRNKCLSFLNSYNIITQNKFNLDQILELGEDFNLIHSRIRIHLNEDVKSVYEYSRFIFEHLIRCSGLLIGEDILSARLGISKDSLDWKKLKEQLNDCKYTGIFSDVYNRWWMSKVDSWWKKNIKEKYSIRHFDSEEKTEILSKILKLNLKTISKAKYNSSCNYWTICKETKLPLDPFDGLELLDEEFKVWQDKEYVSIGGYLSDIPKYSKIVSELDRIEMRSFQ
ncbi:hypothetical protein [Aquirufa ecclesiirivi]|uniref:hypothetical protein n=1 Tax=Aquirufa ecclesiirivi TaxID=2715124 RepID=UPI0023D839E4|nr:hypothetical protein [Aquirufa ecclesiirivi]MDF0694112.1 hypothetical protein [Aquirufa ecclesiirivi]